MHTTPHDELVAQDMWCGVWACAGCADSRIMVAIRVRAMIKAAGNSDLPLEGGG